MNHEHSLGSYMAIPFGLLVVLDDVILVGVGVVDNLISVAALAHGLENDVCRLVKYNQFLPTEEVLLVACVSARSVAAVVVVS